MDFEFKLEGIAELEETLRAMGRAPARRIGSFAVKKGADVIVARAKELAPVRTGALRDAIASAPAKGEDNEVVRHIGVERPVGRRFHLTEFGTVHSRPQPFMRPALDEKAQAAFDTIGEELGGAIERDAARFVTRRGLG